MLRASSAGLRRVGGKLTGPLAVDTSTITISGSSNTLPGLSDFYGHVGTVNGSYSGSQPTSVFVHQIDGYAVNQSGGPSNRGTRFYTNLGGSNQHGGFLNFDSTLFINTTTGNLTGKFYQSGNIAAVAVVNDNGTNGNNLGSLFGNNVYSKLQTGATFWHACIGQETDISIQTGASAWYAGGNSVVLLSDNAVAADRENFGFLVSAQIGAVPTLDLGYGFGGYEGVNPFSPTAALMEWRANGGGLAGGPTIARGVSLTGFSFTGNAFASTNYSVDGVGNIIGATVKTTPTTVVSLPSAATAGAGTRAFVTDATTSTFGSIVAGGGSVSVPVYSDDTNWKIG